MGALVGSPQGKQGRVETDEDDPCCLRRSRQFNDEDRLASAKLLTNFVYSKPDLNSLACRLHK
jgi:hypothetical protein